VELYGCITLPFFYPPSGPYANNPQTGKKVSWRTPNLLKSILIYESARLAGQIVGRNAFILPKLLNINGAISLF
jgi:hypothetical protein